MPQPHYEANMPGLLKHLTWSIVKRSIVIALIVGTILCVINHSDKMLAHTLTSADFIRMGLTYIVPFCVATLGALTAREETQQNQQ